MTKIARTRKLAYGMETISETHVAKLLGISVDDVKKLVQQELLHPISFDNGVNYFSSADIAQIKYGKNQTLSEEAEEVGIQIQREIVSSLSTVQKTFLVLVSGITGYFLVVAILALLFVFFPLQTAAWLGYMTKIQTPLSVSEDPNSKVLAAATSALDQKPTVIQMALKPMSKVSLDIVKYTSPNTYDTIKKITILDVNDVMGLDDKGKLTPLQPVKFLQSGLLQISDPGLVANLNSQYVQGRKPGTNPGDLAIVTDVPKQTEQTSSPPTNNSEAPLVGITNTSLSNSAKITIDTSSPLSGGGLVSLGETITLSCPTCSLSASLFTPSSTDTLTNKTINANFNTISGLTANNLTAGDYSSVITSGTYAIDITGSVVSAINFTGSLAGDVTGTQGSTTVAKINGVVLGTTTASAGNLLIGSGTQWVTQSLSNDATITSGGVLTLKNTGTAGTYGSALTIPVFVTDAQGRITGVTNTAISGLTVSNFGSTNISQWINNSGYITNTSTDILSNKSISAGTNSITGLTNINLSGSAGITNANLANSSVTINTSTGLSGGASVSLGGNLTLTNTGVTSLVGTSNQVTVSDATGSVTLSLSQSIAATSSPTFASLNLTNSTNQLVLGTTNLGTVSWNPSTTRTLTFPDATDTIVGKTTTDILTNKTLTSPAINGTVTTTGLTLPAFSASGDITGVGSPNLTSFGTINGLTFTAATDGVTIAGGTTARTLTVTGANITIGSVIKPTSAGTLTIQSNGQAAIFLDTGGSAAIHIGTGSASAITIGRVGVTTTITATAAANTLTIGGGTTITKHLSATASLSSGAILSTACAAVGTIAVPGAVVGDTVVANPIPVANGIETKNMTWNAYVSSADTVTIRACNITLLSITPAAQTWRVDVWQH